MNKEKMEENLCNFLIYYVLAFGSDDNCLQIMLNTLDKSREDLKNYLNKVPEDHPIINYYKKIESINDEQYTNIVNLLKPKIQKVMNQKDYDLFDAIGNRELINIVTDIIINSSEYNTLKEYIQYNLQNKDPKILYFMGTLQNVQDEEEQGWSLIEESAKKGYNYAKYELAVHYYENKNLSLAEKYLIPLLDITDSYLLSLIQDLLGKIYYYGGNKVQKDTEKALHFFELSAKNFDGYEKQSHNFIKKIQNDNNKDKKARDGIVTINNDSRIGHYSYNRDSKYS